MKKSANMSFVNGRPVGHSPCRAVGHSFPFAAPRPRSAFLAFLGFAAFASANAYAVTATKAYVDSRDASLADYTTGVSNKVEAAQSTADANAAKIAALTSADVKNAAVEGIYTAQRKMSEEVVVSDGTNAVVVSPKYLTVIDTTKPMKGRYYTFPDSLTGQLATTDAIPEVPTAVSAFENDAGYLTAESDPTVPSWAKATTKPSYSASEVGTYTSAEIDSKISAAIPVVSATDATFSNAVNAAARALVKSKLESLDKAKSSIGDTIAALQSIYTETETK